MATACGARNLAPGAAFAPALRVARLRSTDGCPNSEASLGVRSCIGGDGGIFFGNEAAPKNPIPAGPFPCLPNTLVQECLRDAQITSFSTWVRWRCPQTPRLAWRL